MHLEMSLSATIIILLLNFSMALNTVSAQQDKGITNLKFAVEFSEVIDRKIAKELALGRIFHLRSPQ